MQKIYTATSRLDSLCKEETLNAFFDVIVDDSIYNGIAVMAVETLEVAKDFDITFTAESLFV